MRTGTGWYPGSIARVKTSASLDSDQESETDSGSRLVVAVDGPSGAGKSSTSRGVAIALGLRYLDTGAMYRALTWWLLERGADTTDSEAVAMLATGPVIEVSTDPRAPWTRVDGTDVSEAIRTREVTAAVSAVAAVPQVRVRLIAMQRQIIASAPGIVAEGRDIGTVVAPDAPPGPAAGPPRPTGLPAPTRTDATSWTRRRAGWPRTRSRSIPPGSA
jgi:hypothetical protein